MPKAADAGGLRPLWTCPRCGNRFVTRNMWHSCVRVPLPEHFRGNPKARRLFDEFRAAIETTGPVTIVSSKTRIAFMTRVRFAGVTLRKDYVRAALWLTRANASRKAVRIERFGRASYGYHFELRDPDDIDAELRALIGEARRVGDQDYPRQRRAFELRPRVHARRRAG